MGNSRRKKRIRKKPQKRGFTKYQNDPEIKKKYQLKAAETIAKKKLENDKKAKQALKENMNEEEGQSDLSKCQATEILGRGKRRRFVTDYRELAGANPFPKRRTNRKKNETVVKMEMSETDEPNNQFEEIKIEVNEDDGDDMKKEVDEDFSDVKIELLEE